MTEFTREVIATIKKIPKGKVATYLQISELSGKPGASRAVSWILSSSAQKYRLPWHRVIKSKGQIAFAKGTRNFEEQLSRLKKEGVKVSPQGSVDLSQFRWKPRKKKKPKSSRPTPRMFSG